MLAERWLPVAGYEGHYEVSDRGRVRSYHWRKPHILTGRIDRYGYHTVLLSAGGSRCFKVHRLVCAAFHGPPPPGTEVGHLDGTKTNNLPANLAWVTRVEQQAHQLLHGKRRGRACRGHPWLGGRGTNNPNAKLSLDQVAEVRRRAANGGTCRTLGRELGVGKDVINRVIRGVSYAEGSATPTPYSDTQGPDQ